MNAQNLVDSNERKLETPEIMMIAAEHTSSKHTPQVVFGTIMTELVQRKSLGIQNGNTLFLVTPSPGHPGSAFFRALNADVPNNFFQNCLQFIKLTQQNGYNTLVTQFEDANIAKMLRLIESYGHEWFDPSTQMDLQMHEGLYQATIYTDKSFLNHMQEGDQDVRRS